MSQELRLGFRIGTFEIEPLTGLVNGPDGAKHLEPKVIDVLIFLAEHAGNLVERGDILDRVWGRPTSDEVLTRCISELRRALNDVRGRPAYVQTVPKRGYRLIQEVVPTTQTQEGADAVFGQGGSVAPPPRDAALASVAVLPFENHTRDEARRYLADAFTAELHSTLARVDRLLVASRRSSFAFADSKADVQEIGERLGAHYLISGSLQADGPDLRIIAELDDTVTGRQVWAQSYDRATDDILAVQREIAEAVVGAFTTQRQISEMRLAHDAPTDSLDAWGLVQKSRSLTLEYTPVALAAAIDPVQRAIELDPDYAVAHATLGALLVEKMINGMSDDLDRDESFARAAAERAATLAPEDPCVLKMLGLVWTFCGDSQRAIGYLRQAVRLAPFDFGAWGYMGWPLTVTGDPEDLEELKRILERLLQMEPRHPGTPFWLYHDSVADTCLHRYESAAQSINGALALRPDFALGWLHYANALGHRGKLDEAIEALGRCRSINPAMTVGHFESLIKKMTQNTAVIESRVGGLRDIPALSA